MNLERNLNLDIDETTVRERLIAYFQKAGYILLNEEGGAFRFSRGSNRGSWFPLNPSDLKSLASVRITVQGSHQVKVKLDLEVAVKFRDETHYTEDFWSNEVREFTEALTEGKYIPLKSKMLTGRAAWALLKSTSTSLIFIFIWGAISFLVTFLILWLTGYYNSKNGTDPTLVIFLVMVITGIVVYFIYRHWTRRSSDKPKIKKV
jgi:hypothetical protein